MSGALGSLLHNVSGVPDTQGAGCFCCFLQRIISHRHLGSHRNLDRRRFGEQKTAKLPRVLPSRLFVRSNKGWRRRPLSQQTAPVPQLIRSACPQRYPLLSILQIRFLGRQHGPRPRHMSLKTYLPNALEQRCGCGEKTSKNHDHTRTCR